MQSILANRVFNSVSTVVPSQHVVKTTVLTMSSVLAVIGVASSVISKNPILAGASLLLGSTCFIAWIDLGASEQIEPYKDGILKGTQSEKAEGKIIQKIGSSENNLTGILGESTSLLSEIERENIQLRSELEESKASITTLKEANEQSASQIEIMKEKMDSAESEIARLEESSRAQHEASEQAKALSLQAEKTMEQMKKIMISQKAQITQLQGRISDLTRAAGEATGKKTN